MLRRVAVLLALCLPLLVVVAAPAQASPESEFVSRTNSSRASYGLRAYAVRSDLTAVARRQAYRMASQRRMYHNPNLGSEVSGWQAVGENVGRGWDVASIHRAFMSSSSHRANILSTRFTEIGVGVARASNGEIFVSEVFRRPWTVATYTPPPPPTPRPVVRSTTPRASRSGVRRPLATPRKPARRKVVVDPTPARLRYAWAVFRRRDPVTSLDRAIVFMRSNKFVAGYAPSPR